MVDPIGLVSLGLDGVGHLLKLRKRRERRNECLRELSRQLDEAHELLVSSDRTAEDVSIYNDVLIPVMRDAIELLERARMLKGVSAARHAVMNLQDDIEAACGIIERFKYSSVEIESRRVARDARLIRLELQTLKARGETGPVHDPRTVHLSLAVSLPMYSAAFLVWGSQRDPAVCQ